MCGICGVYSATLTQGEKDTFRTLLHLNVFRGENSTGVIKIAKNTAGKHYTHVQRSLLPSPLWLHQKKTKEFLDGPVSLLLGHTRAATLGAVTLKNAHPFEFKGVLGVHNGTIPGDFKFSKDYDTDSEALYRGINDLGIVPTLKQFETKVSAYALAWINKETGTLNFVRNGKRPMHFAFIFGGSTLLWSSDKDHLTIALKHHRYAGVKQGPQEGTTEGAVWSLEPGYLLSLPIGAHPGSHVKITKLGIKPYVIPAWNGTYANGYAVTHYSSHRTVAHNYPDYEGVYRKQKDGEYRTEAEERANKAAGGGREELNGDGYLPWLSEATIPKGAFEDGCICCGFIPTSDQERLVHWADDAWFACQNCYDDSKDNWVRQTIDGNDTEYLKEM